MPLHRTGNCVRWGRRGKRYCGKGARAKALRQARAIRASGWVENAEQDRPTKLRNPGSYDPTRTVTLRRQFEQEFARRFARLRQGVVQLVETEDAFGLRDPVLNAKFSSTQVNIDDREIVESIRHLQRRIDPRDVIEMEDDPHVTIKYGLHDQRPDKVREILYKAGSIDLVLGSLSLFKSDEQDVLKIDVTSRTLRRLNKKLGRLSNTQTHRTYRPHLTIAYLNPGTGDKYLGEWTGLESKTFTASSIQFSDKLRRKSEVVLNIRWRFLSSVDKLRQFRDWLARQVQYIIFGSTTAQIEESWWRQFVERGYRQGQERVFIDVRKAPATSDPKLLEQYAGGKAEFLRGVFGQPTAIEKVQLLAGRIYSDLRGVTEQMGAAIGRELADGIARGDHPHTIARRMARDIDGIGRNRARLIARTEIIRAHAEGQLDAMKRTGVTHVGVAVEWSTADDEHVCPLCRPLDGVILTVEEAHGLIPRHPNCRCAFVPANVGEDKSGQIRGQKKILKAFSRSVSAERPKRKKRSLREQIKRSRWVGAGKRIEKSRPVSILD